jgi:hypothetical protein
MRFYYVYFICSFITAINVNWDTVFTRHANISSPHFIEQAIPYTFVEFLGFLCYLIPLHVFSYESFEGSGDSLFKNEMEGIVWESIKRTLDSTHVPSAQVAYMLWFTTPRIWVIPIGRCLMFGSCWEWQWPSDSSYNGRLCGRLSLCSGCVCVSHTWKGDTNPCYCRHKLYQCRHKVARRFLSLKILCGALVN